MILLIYLFILLSDNLYKNSIYCLNVKYYFYFCRVRGDRLFEIGGGIGMFLGS